MEAGQHFGSRALAEAVPLARTALANSPIFALRVLVVESTDGGLHISGEVSSFYHKQLAQEAVRAAAADVPIVNRVEVIDTPPPDYRDRRPQPR